MGQTHTAYSSQEEGLSPPPYAISHTAPVGELELKTEVNTDLGVPSDSFDRIKKDLSIDPNTGLGHCQRCKLCQHRKTVVFGEGSPAARLMFIGEGPGEQEDLQGRPFVGKAGQLLDKMIEAMGLQRSEVYIANVVKCRPPGNRNPEPDEIASCSPFLFRQVELIRPEVIVALGKFAAQTLLQTDARISALRGKFHPFRGAKLMPTFHPAYLLRNPESKREAWSDLRQVAGELRIEIPKRTPSG